MTSVPDLSLNDGNSIPQIGYGVFKIPPTETRKAVEQALEVGYRHIDTAQMYGNEREVGEAVRASGLAREDVFITSKLNNPFHLPDDARKAFDGTIRDIGLDYIDLFLIHWPLPMHHGGNFVSTWKVMEEFKQDGRARSIGVSNFQVPHLERLLAESETVPAVNQIEAHPYFTNDTVRLFNRKHDIVTEAWAPIAKGRVMDDATILPIAERHGKTPAQVVIRWHLQRGDVVFPKTAKPSRMKENFNVFDFELSPDEMDAIRSLNRGEEGRIGPNPDTFGHLGG